MDDNLEMQQWYSAVDKSARSPINEYETLAEVKTKQNIQNEPGVIAHSNNAVGFQKSGMSDNNMKKWLTILGLLLAVVFTVSVATAVIAVLAYSKSESPQIQTGQRVNISAIVSTELHRIQNESATMEDSQTQMIMNKFSSLSRKLEDFHANLSLLGEQVSSIQLALMNNETSNVANNDLVSLRYQLNGLDLNFNSLRDMVSNLQQMTGRNISSVASDLGTTRNQVTTLTSNLGTTRNQVTTLTSDLGTTRNQVTSLQQTTNSDISSVRNQISSMQNQLNTFTTSVNNRLAAEVNLYQNCRQDTESCTLQYGSGAGAEYYKPYCRTSWLSINVTVS